ncbi:MAG: ribonuclease P protein component 4 [Candidatus Micrarchaeota archaeon]|nr:MAG: ribonuclease P protein component 4 [Candidatus Micrarchaeota archaeon]
MNAKDRRKAIAERRIRELYRLALMHIHDKELSRYYISLMLGIRNHYKVKLSKEIKSYICKYCKLPLYPGVTASVRLVSSHGYLAYRCLSCNRERHIFYK